MFRGNRNLDCMHLLNFILELEVEFYENIAGCYYGNKTVAENIQEFVLKHVFCTSHFKIQNTRRTVTATTRSVI